MHLKYSYTNSIAVKIEKIEKTEKLNVFIIQQTLTIKLTNCSCCVQLLIHKQCFMHAMMKAKNNIS